MLYRESRFPFEQAKLEAWLDEMRHDYELVARESRSFPRLKQDERTLVAVEFVDTFQFVPRDASKKPVSPPLAALPRSGTFFPVGKGLPGGDRQ